jgi:hypothetical protein
VTPRQHLQHQLLGLREISACRQSLSYNKTRVIQYWNDRTTSYAPVQSRTGKHVERPHTCNREQRNALDTRPALSALQISVCAQHARHVFSAKRFIVLNMAPAQRVISF